MTSKAIRLMRGTPGADFTVEQLFEAAFGPEPLEYHYKSLLGWRPVVLTPGSSARWVEKPIPAGKTHASSTSPGVKVYETETLIVVEVELPAIEEESLYLEISGSMLIIRGNALPNNDFNHGLAPTHADKKVHRCIQLPVIARPGEVRARLEGNIVRVMILKQQQAEY